MDTTADVGQVPSLALLTQMKIDLPKANGLTNVRFLIAVFTAYNSHAITETQLKELIK